MDPRKVCLGEVVAPGIIFLFGNLAFMYLFRLLIPLAEQVEQRTDRTAVLSIVGRDQQDQELSLEFDQERCFWNFVSAETEPWKEPPDPVLEAVSKLFTDSTIGVEGPASLLLENLMKIDPDISIAANSLGRKLNVSAERLFNEYGIRYDSTRSHFGRCIKLTKMRPKEETEKKG